MTSTLLRNEARANAPSDKRKACIKAAITLFDSASQQAEAGDLESAGVSILKGLDQERRAGLGGVQVLQLIKPTNKY